MVVRVLPWLGAGFLACLIVGCAVAPYQIDVSENPRAYEATAAKEFDDWLKQVALNGQITVEGKDGVVFHVGETGFARAHGLGAETFKDEEWCIRSFGHDVVLTGGGRRGTLYAVSHFLEDQCNIRFWMDDETDVPTAKPLSFGALDRRGRPFFRRRVVFRADGADPRTAVRCRLNGNGNTTIPPAWGGEGYTHGGVYHGHVWDRYLPFKKYGKEHPEWYSLKDGKRIGGQHAGQLCLTCPGLADVFSEKVEAFVRKDVEKAEKTDVDRPLLYALSPNDNHHYCTCGTCRTEIEKYGMSGYVLRFQNAVAERIHRKYPHVRFAVSAYHETEEVPKGGVAPRSDMVVKIANTRGNLNTSPREGENAVMQKLLRDWGALVDEINVHEYARTFSFQTSGHPLPSEFSIVDRLRYYGENKVTGGLFELEGAEWSDMYELKYYLLRRAFEDPSVDSDALIREFMDRFYGAAGADVLAMRRYLEQVRRASGAFVVYSPNISDFDCFTVEVLTKAGKMLDEAERKVANDGTRLSRVKRARTSIDRLMNLRRRFSTFSDPEPGVSAVPFLDFPVDRTMWCPYPGSDTKFAKDAEAIKGLSVRVEADGKLRDQYGFPFKAGFRADKLKKAISNITIDRANGRGYQWYELGEITVPEGDLLVWMTRMWTIQFKLLSPELVGKKCRVRLHMKLMGPAFQPGEKGESRIDIDRLVFIPEGKL